VRERNSYESAAVVGSNSRLLPASTEQANLRTGERNLRKEGRDGKGSQMGGGKS
jgi:hypothetical protein